MLWSIILFKGENHAISKKFETKYEERDVWINQRTGEVAEFDQITKKVPRQGFEITYLSYFFDLFDQLGGKNIKFLNI